jgi:hypothetical protein
VKPEMEIAMECFFTTSTLRSLTPQPSPRSTRHTAATSRSSAASASGPTASTLRLALPFSQLKASPFREKISFVVLVRFVSSFLVTSCSLVL